MPLGMPGNRRDTRDRAFGIPSRLAADPFGALVGVVYQTFAASRVPVITLEYRLYDLG